MQGGVGVILLDMEGKLPDSIRRAGTATRRPQRAESTAEGPRVSTHIAEQVKGMILDGKLELGAPVREKWLTDHFGASRTTVREALAQLVTERYLDQEPYRGARVRTYSKREVEDILQARTLLEGFAADNCANASEAGRTRLRLAFGDYASKAASQQHYAAAMAHVELHVAIVGLTGNETLVRLEHELMIGSLLLIDLINWHLQDSEKMYMEHLRLVNALLEPDSAKARELTDDHLGMVLTAAQKQLPETAQG